MTTGKVSSGRGQRKTGRCGSSLYPTRGQYSCSMMMMMNVYYLSYFVLQWHYSVDKSHKIPGPAHYVTLNSVQIVSQVACFAKS